MKRRFVIAINNETSEEVSAILAYFKQKGFGWWHWFGNVWLLTTTNYSVSATSIRDELKIICNRRWLIVLEVEKRDWANFGPQGGQGDNDKDISQWFRDVWNSDY